MDNTDKNQSIWKKEEERKKEQYTFPEKIILNPHIGKEVKNRERLIEDKYNKCRRCLYRDSDMGLCFYTYVTGNKKSLNRVGPCKHFVDIEEWEDILNSVDSRKIQSIMGLLSNASTH